MSPKIGTILGLRFAFGLSFFERGNGATTPFLIPLAFRFQYTGNGRDLRLGMRLFSDGFRLLRIISTGGFLAMGKRYTKGFRHVRLRRIPTGAPSFRVFLPCQPTICGGFGAPIPIQ
jgi:hypothetical protein